MNLSLLSEELVEYCFENVSNSCVKVNRSLALKIVMYFLLVFTVVLTVFGNLFVMISISHFKQLHSPNNVLVLSLANADFLVGLLVLPFCIIRSVETCWYWGSFLCRLHTCMDLLLCTVSIYHLCFIAIDRYYAICEPLHYTRKINYKVISLFIFLAWMIPGVCSFGIIYSKSNEQGLEDVLAILTCEGGCLLLYNKLWALLGPLIFIAPCVVMIGIYTKIFCVAKRQAKIANNRERKILSDEDNKMRVTQKREQKAAKTLGIIMGIFLLCWLPFFIDIAVDVYVDFSTPMAISETITWLGYVNSAFNPLIYALFYPWFRKALKMIVTGRIFSSGSSDIQLYTQ
ncbi:trace amine-associated receptor 4-like [Erpetoichthys calabaricus]|uniref:trace amine-associated receptor 4-like n=1 Tax=Erpetoichthys calabaricus TaxID=27687 RepID=UPI0010A0BFAE|nr:trace amine-associated receptor 4-like [Erpetoichthys calabaricus]